MSIDQRLCTKTMKKSQKNSSSDKNVARMREKRKKWRFFAWGTNAPPPYTPLSGHVPSLRRSAGLGGGGELVQSQ